MRNTGEQLYTTKLSDVEIRSLQRYEYARSYCQGKDVLDAACGCGYGSNILSHQAKSVLGVDNSQEAIDYAQRHWGTENITFKQFDLDSEQITLGAFDVIVSLETIEHIDTPILQTCRKFHRILRPGGLLVMSHPEKEIDPAEKAKTNPSAASSLNKSMAEKIKRAVYYLRHRNFSILWDFIKSRTWGSIKGKILNKTPSVSYHKHFNINGELVRKGLTEIGFQIKDEWHQPGRFYYTYHIIVGEKK